MEGPWQNSIFISNLSMALSYSLKMACFQEHNTWDLSPMSLWEKKPFPLCKDLRRPFPGVRLPPGSRVFIYLLSSTRTIILNTFGSTVHQNHCCLYCKDIYLNPEKVDSCVKMTLVLCDYIRRNNMTRKELMSVWGDLCLLGDLRTSFNEKTKKVFLKNQH